MSFKLSQRSLDKLEGVHPDMVKCVTSAIEWSKVDFGVICGMRTEAEQKELVAKGASQTMKSKHLEGLAVDLMAYVGSRASWELNLYDDIADAMKKACINQGKRVTWGAAWQMELNKWNGTSEELMNAYIDLRRSEGRRPFIDGPHFQLET